MSEMEMSKEVVSKHFVRRRRAVLVVGSLAGGMVLLAALAQFSQPDDQQVLISSEGETQLKDVKSKLKAWTKQLGTMSNEVSTINRDQSTLKGIEEQLESKEISLRTAVHTVRNNIVALRYKIHNIESEDLSTSIFGKHSKSTAAASQQLHSVPKARATLLAEQRIHFHPAQDDITHSNSGEVSAAPTSSIASSDYDPPGYGGAAADPSVLADYIVGVPAASPSAHTAPSRLPPRADGAALARQRAAARLAAKASAAAADAAATAAAAAAPSSSSSGTSSSLHEAAAAAVKGGGGGGVRHARQATHGAAGGGGAGDVDGVEDFFELAKQAVGAAAPPGGIYRQSYDSQHSALLRINALSRLRSSRRP